MTKSCITEDYNWSVISFPNPLHHLQYSIGIVEAGGMSKHE